MTKISIYNVDGNVAGNDRWIGTDAQNFNATKNFTPNGLADYFNHNQVIDSGNALRYTYQTLDPLEARRFGTISFINEIGPQVPFEDISTFLLSKYTLKYNIISEYLQFLNGAKVVISKASDTNFFGLYKITNVNVYLPEPNFFNVDLSFIDGNGSMNEDQDYIISLVLDKYDQPVTNTSQLINDGEDGVHPFITAQDIPSSASTLQEVTDNGNTTTNTISTGNIIASDVSGGDAPFTGSFNSDDSSSLLSFTNLKIGGNSGVLRVVDYSAFREWTLPDQTGTIALTSDIPPYVTPTLNSVLAEGDTGTGKNITLTLEGDGITNNGGILTLFDYTVGNIDNAIQLTPYVVTASDNTGQTTLGRYSISQGDGTNSTSLEWAAVTSNEVITIPNSTGTLALTSQIPTVGTWGALNYPTWTSGTPFVKMTAAGTFALDTNTYLTSASLAGYVPYTGATSDLNLGVHGLVSDKVSLNTTITQSLTGAGQMMWNDTDGTLDIRLKGNNVTLQVGQEIVVRVVNKSGANLLEADFQAVRVRSVAEGGAAGQRLAIVLAQGDSDAHSATTIGIVTETINNNQEGFITTSGEVREINTTGAKSYGGLETWVDGDMLFLDPYHAGYLTNVKPVAPSHLIVIGYVVYAHAIHGKIFVKVDNGYELNELHNVLITSAANNEGLFYESSTSLWKNKSISTVLGYTPLSAAVVSLNGLTGATQTFSTGTTGTDFGISSTGTTHTFNIPTASSTNRGLLSSTDWTTFNSKGNGTVTSVAALTLGTTGTDLSSTVATGTTTPVITLNVPTASATNRGALSSTDWSTFNNKPDTLQAVLSSQVFS